jgi:hypothetical protein
MNGANEPGAVVTCLGARSFGAVDRTFAKIRANFNMLKTHKYIFTNSITRSSTQINDAITHI